jgi:hypothetical protein
VVGAVPGVRAAGLTTVNPLGGASWTAPVVAEGSRDGDAVQVHHRLVTPSAFEAMGIPLVGGRLFSPDDDARRPFVVLVSAAMAGRLWGDGPAVGKRVRLAVPDAPWFTVVGIVGNVQDSRAADAPAETWYLPVAQHAGSPAADELHLMVRAADGLPPASHAIRSALAGIDRTLAATDLTSMEEYYAGTIERERFGAGAMTSVGLFGLVLASLGVYAVMAFAVAERRPEIGVRIALGATRREIVGLLLGRGLRLGAVGVLAGTAAAHGVVRLIEAAMPGVRASEALALAAASVLLLLVLLLACYLPARRAARTDPLLVLRQE